MKVLKLGPLFPHLKAQTLKFGFLSCSAIGSFIILHNCRETATENKHCAWRCIAKWHYLQPTIYYGETIMNGGVKEYMDDVFSQPIKPGHSQLSWGKWGQSIDLYVPTGVQPCPLIANIVIKGHQWEDHRRRLRLNYHSCFSGPWKSSKAE